MTAKTSACIYHLRRRYRLIYSSGSKAALHHDHMRSWAKGDPVGPLVIEVAPTRGCNHACLHCGFQQFDPYEPEKTFLNADKFNAFLDDFHAMGGKEIYFAGNGEPMLNPSLPQMLRHGKSLDLKMTMSTNGLPLVPKRVDDYLPYMDWIRFSINGGQASPYAKVHACPETDFNKLMKNLQAASEFRDAKGLDVELVWQFIIYDLNWKTAEDAVHLHKEVGTNRLIFRNMSEESGENTKSNPEILDLLRSLTDDPSVEVRWDTFERTQQPDWHTCHGINFRTNMDHQGNLIACNRSLVMNSSFGTIYTKSFREIWSSMEKQCLFKDIASGTYIPMCAKFCQASYDNKYVEEADFEFSAASSGPA